MLFHRLTSLAGSIALYLSLGFCAAGADDASTLQRWLYCSQNLWVDKNIDELEALFRRAAKAGYTHVLLTDSKFSKLGDMDTRYFRNVERVKRWFAGRGHQQVIAAITITNLNRFVTGWARRLVWKAWSE